MAGTTGSSWSTINNVPRSKLLNHVNTHALKQPDAPHRLHNNSILNAKKLNTIDIATTATISKAYHTASADQHPTGRLNYRHQSEQLQTALDLPSAGTQNGTSTAMQTIQNHRAQPG